MQFLVLLQVIRGEGNAEVLRRPKFSKPLQRVGRFNQVVAVVLDRDLHARFFRNGEMRLHLLDELAHRSLEFSAFEAARSSSSTDDRGTSKPLGQSHFFLQTERAELVLRDAAELNIVFFQQRSELRLAHLIELLSLVAVDFGPDVDCRRADLRNLRDDLVQSRIAVHT